MNYLKIDKEDVCNGEGLRVVLWLSGCSHKCKGCQNPQTWDADSGISFDESAKEELFRELDKDYISGLTLTGGDPLFEGNLDDVLDLVTEVNKRYNTPQNIDSNNANNNNILNADDNKIRLSSPQKSIWLYTGYKFDEIFGENQFENLDSEYDKWNKKATIVAKCNVLVDGRYIESNRDITLKWCGSKNQKVIDIQKSLKEGKTILWRS